MKEIKVVVPWHDGLHMRPAARLVKTAKHFRSKLFLRCGDQIADLRSVVSIVSLCATMGMTLSLSASGEDEHAAALAVAQIFSSQDLDRGESLSVVALPNQITWNQPPRDLAA